MSQTFPHIVILGAGLIGLCTADHLLAKGAKVTVIDARSGPCEGTSFSNSGMIHPSQACSWAKDDAHANFDAAAARVTADLGKRSAVLLKTRMRELGLPDRPSGCVQIYPSVESARTAQTGFNVIGIHADILIDPIETFNQPACAFPDDLSGNAKDFGCALAADLTARGVTSLYNTDNFAVRRQEDGIFKIMAGEARLDCDQLIIAAGIQTPAVLKRLDVRMTLDPVSGVAVNFTLPHDKIDLPSRPVMDAASRTALTVFDNHVRISGGWNVSDPKSILARWQEISPELMARLGAPLSTWHAQRPVSPVGRPYISSTSIPGLWVNTGHGHMGWTLCAGSGELLANMIVDGVSDKRFTFAG
ncbi:NAD(P)/FAD-dependent oxidoreductase [Litorimonas sp. WD9-15]|uniref:NAD(P)/FAD-dependent oxidoreductase n=1 Tax=Litorimonas sp. WD9-15 TaxID=3418716 RepID=UPI003CFE2CC7